MRFRRRVANVFEQVTGLKVTRKLPRGADLFSDLQRLLPNTAIQIVFDVGANIGQSASAYSRHFPAAKLHCFEPAASVFRELQANVRSMNAEAHHLALTAESGTGRIGLHQTVATMHALTDASGEGTEEVRLQSLDDFCAERCISNISFLKIDTEGHDLEVLKGAQRMLAGASIDVVEVEAGMNPTNEWHVPFEALKGFLEAQGYFLFGVYEQHHEWPTKAPHLRRTNPVFISPKTIAANSG